MKDQISTIRVNADRIHSNLAADPAIEAERILTALSELEQMAREPFAYFIYFPDQQRGEFAHDLDELCEDMTNDENHEVTPLYRATPPAQQPPCPLCNYQHGHAIGCENNPVDIALEARAAQQPQARPSFKEWTTDYVRDNLHKLKQPQAEAVPPDVVRDAARYRWLFSGRTEDELNADVLAGRQPIMTAQDQLIADFSAWYTLKKTADAKIDAAMAQGAKI